MAAYAVVNVRVTDPVRYEEYRSKAPATIASYGGRYLVRGGALQVLEASGTQSAWSSWSSKA